MPDLASLALVNVTSKCVLRPYWGVTYSLCIISFNFVMASVVCKFLFAGLLDYRYIIDLNATFWPPIEKRCTCLEYICFQTAHMIVPEEHFTWATVTLRVNHIGPLVRYVSPYISVHFTKIFVKHFPCNWCIFI